MGAFSSILALADRIRANSVPVSISQIKTIRLESTNETAEKIILDSPLGIKEAIRSWSGKK